MPARAGALGYATCAVDLDRARHGRRDRDRRAARDRQELASLDRAQLQTLTFLKLAIAGHMTLCAGSLDIALACSYCLLWILIQDQSRSTSTNTSARLAAPHRFLERLKEPLHPAGTE